jgi:hypothetical protein
MALTALRDGLGVVRGDAAKKGFALDKITIFVCDPVTNGVGACKPTVMSGQNFRGNTAFVCTV